MFTASWALSCSQYLFHYKIHQQEIGWFLETFKLHLFHYTCPSWEGSNGVQVPKITERQLQNCLTHLKKTATGPDPIPFWVWRDHAEIFAPIICKIWKYLALIVEMCSCDPPRHGIYPLGNRGINITPVIARALILRNPFITSTHRTLLNIIRAGLYLAIKRIGGGVYRHAR